MAQHSSAASAVFDLATIPRAMGYFDSKRCHALSTQSLFISLPSACELLRGLARMVMHDEPLVSAFLENVRA
jgi:hypothetical protein